MNVGRLARVGLVSAAASALVIAAFTGACGFDPPPKHSGSTGGGKCSASAGTIPQSDCDDSDQTCTGGGCTIASKCGAQDTCLPLADNGSKPVADFRIRRLNVAVPATLAEQFIQSAIITKNIDLNSKACGELGNGAFNWLFRIDKAGAKLTTGGAPPSPDPFTLGYCFYDHTTPEGLSISPAQVKLTYAGDTFTSEAIPRLSVPIFLNGDINNIIILPISDATFSKVTVSQDNNCIGKFEPAALESDCTDDPSTCSKWRTNGALAGYITLEEADTVPLKDLNESLCVLLAKATKDANGKCPREGGKINLPPAQQGDFCSTTKKAGDCRDSFWLAATFAASAIRIHDGTAVAECTAGASDGGVDGGQDTGTDSPADAQTDGG